MNKDRLALVLFGVLYLLAWGYDSNVLAQNRRADDRVKDSQDICGYTLAKDQVQYLSENNSFIKLDLVGSPEENLQKIQDGPVCAFKVDNPDLTDVTVLFATKVDARPYAVPPRIQDKTTGVLLSYKRK